MKRVPLTKRLEVALTQTSSDSEKDTVYGLLAKVAKDVLSEDEELFYGTLTHQTLSLTYNRKPINSIEILEGKKLAEYLKSSINLPVPGNTQDYRGKMIKAMKVEYQVLRRYFKK